MIATPKTKLHIEPVTSNKWRCHVDSTETMAKLENLPSEYGLIKDKEQLNFLIILNPCYNKKDIVLAMYSLIDQAVPTELWNKLAEEHTAPTGTVTLPTDHAEAEKDSAKELFGPATFLYSKTVRKLTSTR